MQGRPGHAPPGGRIEVIAGGMFSGKSEELVRRLRRALIARQRIQVFKPLTDSRHPPELLITRDNRELEARTVRSTGELQVESLVFDTLQIAILIAVILTAGATLQAIEMLSEYLMNRGPIFDRLFGMKLLSIVLLVILTILFYLLHHVVRSFRLGWQPRRPPPRVSAPSD